MSLAIKHIQISRGDFDALAPKDTYAIYFVIETDNTISLYTGDKAVSQDVRITANVAAEKNPLTGKVYYDTTAKTCFIYNGTSFVYLMGDTYVFHYDAMPEVTIADNGRTAIYTGTTDVDKGLIQGNAYKVINGTWAGITQESSNLQLAGLDYQGTTVLGKDSVASAGTADVAARADHSHALSTEVITAIEDVATLKASVSSNTTEIGSAKAAIASNTEVISTVTQNIASNTKSISDLSGVVNTNSTLFSEAIASNTADITVNAAAISSNTVEIGSAKAAIASNTTAISSVNTSVSSNTKSISDLSGVVNTNSTLFSESIASNTDSIGVNTTAIASLTQLCTWSIYTA